MRKNEQTQSKLFSVSYFQLIFISLITALGYCMVSPLISSRALELGANLSMAGVVVGSFSIAALLSRPFGGIASDNLSKKWIAMAASGLLILCFIGYAVSSDLLSMSFFRVLHGVAFGFSGTASMALVSEITPRDRMGEGLGYYGLGQVLAQIVGPSLGIAVTNTYGLTTLFLLAAAVSCANILVLLFFKYKNTAVRQAHTPFSLDKIIAKECIVYALIAGLFSLCNGVVTAFLVLLGEQRGIGNIALFFSVNAITVFALRLIIGKLIDRSSLTLIVTVSLVVSATAMGIIGGAYSLGILLIASVLKSLGQGAGQLSLQSACVIKVDAAHIGIATSTYYIGADIGNGLGPVIGGWLSDAYGYTTMFALIAALLVLSMIFFLFYQKRNRSVCES